MHADEPDPAAAPTDETTEPSVVTVAGTGSTPDKPVAMIQGVTGARIPTGDHPTSGAMPDQRSSKVAGGSGLGIAIGAIALLVIAYVLWRLLA